MEPGLLAVFQRLSDATRGLPDIVETTSYGTPALKAGKKLLTRVKDAHTAVLTTTRAGRRCWSAWMPSPTKNCAIASSAAG